MIGPRSKQWSQSDQLRDRVEGVKYFKNAREILPDRIYERVPLPTSQLLQPPGNITRFSRAARSLCRSR